MVGIIGISAFGSATAYPTRNGHTLPEVLPYDEILEIINADYLDLDDDGIEDDIITEFIFRVPTENMATMECGLRMELEMPSGDGYYSTYSFTESFVEIIIDMEWYNVATESGDYIFSVRIDFSGVDDLGYSISGRITETIIFDPPTTGAVGGEPFGIIFFRF